MPPSSVIFIVLLGVWAAYFVLYWLRRREHLATARTADQLTTSLRVLERRSPVAETTATPRSYAASPTRAVSPGVRAALDDDPVAAPVTRPERARVTSMRPSRRVRGLTLLLGLLATLVAVPTAALGYLSWPTVLAPAALLVLGFAWLRAGVQAQIRARRLVAEARPGAAPAPIEIVPTPAAGSSRSAVDADVMLREDLREEEVADLADEVVAPAPAPAAAAPARPLVDEDDIPLTWDPIPVPKPTYAMKAKAERPAPVPAETTPAPEPVPLQDAAYAEPERRVAGA